MNIEILKTLGYCSRASNFENLSLVYRTKLCSKLNRATL